MPNPQLAAGLHLVTLSLCCSPCSCGSSSSRVAAVWIQPLGPCAPPPGKHRTQPCTLASGWLGTGVARHKGSHSNCTGDGTREPQHEAGPAQIHLLYCHQKGWACHPPSTPAPSMMPKRRKLHQWQMCQGLAVKCTCCYQGRSIASLGLDFFLSIVLVIFVLFLSLIFLNYSH